MCIARSNGYAALLRVGYAFRVMKNDLSARDFFGVEIFFRFEEYGEFHVWKAKLASSLRVETIDYGNIYCQWECIGSSDWDHLSVQLTFDPSGSGITFTDLTCAFLFAHSRSGPFGVVHKAVTVLLMEEMLPESSVFQNHVPRKP